MTDNDIVKDLESVIGWFTNHGSNTNTAVIEISRRAIDVVERQKAEVEQWKEEANKHQSLWASACTEAKSEAVREFAERLKTEIKSDLYGDDVMPRGTIDWLVKEMTEQ